MTGSFAAGFRRALQRPDPVRSTTGGLVRWPLLLVVGLALQDVAAFAVARGSGDVPRSALFAASYTALIAGVAANLRYLGFKLLLVGVLLNAVVVGANGWRMPIDPTALASTGYVEQRADAPATIPSQPKHSILPRSEIRLWPLADIIPVSPVRRVFSVGDMFALAGTVLAIGGIVRRARRRASARYPDRAREGWNGAWKRSGDSGGQPPPS